MDGILFVLVLEVLFFGLLALLFWLLVMRPISREKARRKSPFTKVLLKSAGEGCAQKIDDLNDDLDSQFSAISIIFAGVIGICLGLFSPKLNSPIPLGLLGILALSGVLFSMLRMRKLLRNRIDYQLGLDGERHTAQALQPLLADGYELFHDLEFTDPTGKRFNIDHVLLGPAGVIAIETKARSKDAAGKGSKSTKVRYDGEKLIYPSATETHSLEQVLANAKFLSRELTSHTGEPVFVRPAISLPGWFVDQLAKNVSPAVHNPEMLRSWVAQLPPGKMDPAQRNRIRGYLASVR